MHVNVCVFPYGGDPGQRLFADGVTGTAAQTAELYSCGVPMTERYKDYIVRTYKNKRGFLLSSIV